MTIPASDLQPLSHSGIIELYTLDLTPIGTYGICRFCNYNQTTGASVSFGGVVYNAYPIETSGFEIKSSGTIPTPSIKLSNIFGCITGLINNYADIVGAKIIRTRTLVKYLDGQPAASPTTKFPDDIWYVERKVSEDKIFVEFQLASILDLEGAQIPARLMFQDACTWGYRGDGCGYTGGPVADEFDIPTSDPTRDKCSQAVSGCRLRFGQFATLPFGGFPGLDKQ